jgi:hypothetical protein
MVRPGSDMPVESRLLLLVGLGLWLLSGAASVWEVLALQAPESPFRFGILTGPIAQLRSTSFGLGAVLLAVALLWPWLYRAGEGRAVLVLLALGALMHTLALWIAAARGLLAVQLLDPRADARILVYARLLGTALSWLAGLLLCAPALRGLRRMRG